MNPTTKNPLRLAATLPLIAVLFSGCATTRITSQNQTTGMAYSRPPIIYVEDFRLDAADIRNDRGIISGPLSDMPGIVGRLGNRLNGKADDPEARASQLVQLMANTLVKDVAKAGLRATRLAPGSPLPEAGWLIQGDFTTVQEGNRLRRAVIGFGAGATDLKVAVTVNDLSSHGGNAISELSTDANSGKLPGAAPTVILSPFGLAVHFVISGKDMDRSVKQTASKIAAQINQRIST